jgi:outer membrane protein OmpA-like peptidoglycan-associated protein
MQKKIIAITIATSISLTAGGCANDPSKTVHEREKERNIITVIAAVGGAMAANAAGVDNTLGKVAIGALAGFTARKVYGDIKADTASDKNTDVSAVKIDGKEYVQIDVKNVNFRSGSSKLDTYELTRLKPVLDALQNYPRTRVHVEGHTDSVGEKQFNQRLSENRAKNVSFYLMDNGISRDRIIIYGYGEERPIASNHSEQHRRMNRRVTFLISEI